MPELELSKQEIVDECRQVVESAKTAYVMATVTPEGKPHLFYMGAAVVEEPFTIYVETFRSSHKVAHLRGNQNVELLFATPKYEKVVTISGTAQLEESPKIKRMVWDNVPASAEYFDSPDAGEFAVIKIRVSRLQLQLQTTDPHRQFVAEL